MKPKDLLQFLEKDDRTMQDIKAAEDRKGSPKGANPVYGSLSNPLNFFADTIHPDITTQYQFYRNAMQYRGGLGFGSMSAQR